MYEFELLNDTLVYPDPPHYLWEDLKLALGHEMYNDLTKWVHTNVPEVEKLEDGVQLKWVHAFMKRGKTMPP